jgi:hypothetical protein
MVGQFALKQIVDLGNDLFQPRSLLLVQRARTGLRERRQLGRFTISERQLPFALILEAVMRELNLREVNTFALPAELQ